MKDNLYKNRLSKVPPFVFNKDVAEAFDDMATRSIPSYREALSLIASIAIGYYKIGTCIYDLGCSTGNLIIEIDKQIKLNGEKKFNPSITGVDLSADMIGLARSKCSNIDVHWICSPVENISFEKSSVVVATYVLQFIKRQLRKEIIRKIYNSLTKGGIFILSEKTISSDKIIEKLQTDLYHDYKLKQGYSPLEIDQKSKALENVLIPETTEAYYETLRDTGFKRIDTILKYLNFTCIIAIK